MQGIVITASLVFGAVIGLILSFVLLKFGEIIDRYPSGDEESRDKNWGALSHSQGSQCSCSGFFSSLEDGSHIPQVEIQK